MTDYVGHLFGKYRVDEQIAKGGMATVYKGWQSNMNRPVAIKMLPPQFTHDDTFLERFYREAEVVASLQHPHILPVYDFGEYDNCPYLVMAYLNGGTLADLISEGPMDAREVGHLVQQMADALDYAHSKGIIHRDFKPSNVLLDERGNTYLADFGLAKLVETASEITGTAIIGTPTYMAPEQVTAAELTPAADIYALGVTIFQMLSGHVPYDAPTAVGIMMAHATEPIPDIRSKRPELTDEAQTVISRSMAKRAHDRYPTPGALASSLAFALQVATHELASLEDTKRDALIMTNMVGQVIFVDNPCLRLLKRHHSEARSIIGRQLSDVLRIDRADADKLIEMVKDGGSVQNYSLTITDAYNVPLPIQCTATATRDEAGTFVGVDLTLRSAMPVTRQEDFDTDTQILDSKESELLLTYFSAHMENLRVVIVQLGGQRLGNYMDKLINETAERNVWPIKMQNGRISVDASRPDADAYRALLAKAVAYAVSLIGKKMVLRGVERVESRLDPNLRKLVNNMMLEELISDIVE